MIAVHNTFSLNWIFRSGFCISGKILQKGFTNSKNLIPMMSSYASYLLASLCVWNWYRNNVEFNSPTGRTVYVSLSQCSSWKCLTTRPALQASNQQMFQQSHTRHCRLILSSLLYKSVSWRSIGRQVPCPNTDGE